METTRIVELIEDVMTGDPWHGSNVRDLLSAVSATDAARSPQSGAHSIWELVLHMTGWAREVTMRLEGRPAQEPDGGDWPAVGEPTPERWEMATTNLFTVHRALAAAMRGVDVQLLAQPVIDYRNDALGTGLSHYRTIHGVIHHTVYHVGQIALIARMMA